jgi:hypothetical protein
MHSGCAQVSLRSRDGACLTLVSGAQGSSGGGSGSAEDAAPGALQRLVRFEGLRLPGTGSGRSTAAAGAADGAPAPGSSAWSAGVVGAAPLGDAFVASAWAEGRRRCGAGAGARRGADFGWGVGLHSQPDAGGSAVGLVLARPASSGGGGGSSGGGSGAAPLLCELSWRLPLADGLELSPGAMVVRAAGAGTATALRIGASWRF